MLTVLVLGHRHCRPRGAMFRIFCTMTQLKNPRLRTRYPGSSRTGEIAPLLRLRILPLTAFAPFDTFCNPHCGATCSRKLARHRSARYAGTTALQQATLSGADSPNSVIGAPENIIPRLHVYDVQGSLISDNSSIR